MAIPSRPGSPPEDSPLLDRLRAGDPDAFDLLVRRHGGRMLASARRILRDEGDARDAVQDAFLSAYRGIGRFRAGSSVGTWLHRIAVNAALMRLRSRRRRREESIDGLLPGYLPDGHRDVPDDDWREGPDRLDRRETRALVRACIEGLPERYRNVLLLRDIEELSTAEAAAALGITENATKIRLHRARQALRGLLAPHFAAGEG